MQYPDMWFRFYYRPGVRLVNGRAGALGVPAPDSYNCKGDLQTVYSTIVRNAIGNAKCCRVRLRHGERSLQDHHQGGQRIRHDQEPGTIDPILGIFLSSIFFIKKTSFPPVLSVPLADLPPVPSSRQQPLLSHLRRLPHHQALGADGQALRSGQEEEGQVQGGAGQLVLLLLLLLLLIVVDDALTFVVCVFCCCSYCCCCCWWW